VGRRHGLRLGRARTHHVRELIRPDDLIVAVCDNAHEELIARPPAPAGVPQQPGDGPGPGRSWLHWAVSDPVRIDTDGAFEAAYTDLSHRIDRLAGTLAAHDSAPEEAPDQGATS
jgi:protein-tyrosine-phosphatase